MLKLNKSYLKANKSRSLLNLKLLDIFCIIVINYGHGFDRVLTLITVSEHITRVVMSTDNLGKVFLKHVIVAVTLRLGKTMK